MKKFKKQLQSGFDKMHAQSKPDAHWLKSTRGALESYAEMKPKRSKGEASRTAQSPGMVVFRPYAGLVAAVLLIVFSGSTVVFASWHAEPGDRLYPVRQATERVVLALKKSDEIDRTQRVAFMQKEERLYEAPKQHNEKSDPRPHNDDNALLPGQYLTSRANTTPTQNISETTRPITAPSNTVRIPASYEAPTRATPGTGAKEDSPSTDTVPITEERTTQNTSTPRENNPVVTTSPQATANPTTATPVETVVKTPTLEFDVAVPTTVTPVSETISTSSSTTGTTSTETATTTTATSTTSIDTASSTQEVVDTTPATSTPDGTEETDEEEEGVATSTATQQAPNTASEAG